MNKKTIRNIIIVLLVFVVICGVTISMLRKKQNEESKIINKQYLNQEELSKFSTYLSKIDNYGFLLSDYNNPNEIKLDKVMYAGAGIEKILTKDEEKEYLEIVKQQTININITAIVKSDIEKFFQEKTGEKLLNIEEKLKDWVYLPKANKYSFAHGDSNYSKMECTLGTKEDNTYTLYVDAINGVIKNCKVTLEKQEDKYIFKTNKTNY